MRKKISSTDSVQCVSDDELQFRWDYMQGKYPDMTPEEANKKCLKIRKKKGMKR